MGFWQLDRADQKEAMRSEYEQKSHGNPLDLNNAGDGLRSDAGRMRWQHSQAQGQFQLDEIFLLDNQIMHGKAGYYVYLSFLLTGKHQQVLVNYGWVPAGSDRRVAPTLDFPQEETVITGVAKDVPSTGIKLAETTEEKLGNNIYRLQTLDLQTLAEKRNGELLPYVLRLEAPAPKGFFRDWPEPGFGKEKHLGYAFQWFALATALVIIYLVVNVKKISNDRD